MAIIGTITLILRLTMRKRNAIATARAMMANKKISAALGTTLGIFYGNMTNEERIRELIANAEKFDGLSFIKERIANRDQIRKERKKKLKELIENDKRNKTNGS